MSKKVASSLVNVVESSRMKTILDKSACVQPVIDELMSHWSYDLYSRKPGEAYTEDGVFVGTDLDLACFLFALAERNAVINIPVYKSRRPQQITEGEMITSKDNRHGKILAVLANKENFAFSVRINDANVMTSDEVGNFRNFMIVDVDGKLYDGWKTIDFIPQAKENDFITNNKLWTGNSVIFKHFVHPNRWISFFGQHYYTTKVLIERLTEEAKILKDAATKLRAQGVIIGGGSGEKKEWPKKTVVGEQQSIKIQTLEAEVDFPDYTSEFPIGNEISLVPNYTGKSKSEMLKAIEDRARAITYSIIPKLRFAARATEYAFFQYGDNGAKMPMWIEDARWDRSYVVKGKKKVWNRMVFTRGVAIRYRVWEKSEIVAAE